MVDYFLRPVFFSAMPPQACQSHESKAFVVFAKAATFEVKGRSSRVMACVNKNEEACNVAESALVRAGYLKATVGAYGLALNPNPEDPSLHVTLKKEMKPEEQDEGLTPAAQVIKLKTVVQARRAWKNKMVAKNELWTHGTKIPPHSVVCPLA